MNKSEVEKILGILKNPHDTLVATVCEEITENGNSKIDVIDSDLAEKLIKDGIDYTVNRMADQSSESDNFKFIETDGLDCVITGAQRAYISSKEDFATIVSAGDDSRSATDGSHASVTSSGDNASVLASGDRANITTSGERSIAVSTGETSRISSSSSESLAITMGESSLISTTGGGSTSVTTGKYSHAVAAGNNSKVQTTGSLSHAVAAGAFSAASTMGSGSHAVTTAECSNASASGIYAIAASLGRRGKARASHKGFIILAEYNTWGELVDVKTARVDGEKIKPDTWYELVDGEFVETTSDD